MRVKETTVFQFDELSDRAKERARDWYREGIESDQISEGVLEDFNTIAGMLGVEIYTRTAKLMGGGTRQEPVIYWDLGRGGGVAFNGRYRYAKGGLSKVREHAPQDQDLHLIARDLQEAQKRCGYAAVVDIKGRDRSMTLDFDNVSDTQCREEHIEVITDALNRLGHWLHSALKRECEYLYSDVCVDEGIKCNEYEFDEEGRRTLP